MKCVVCVHALGAQAAELLSSDPTQLDGEAVLMGQVAMKNIVQVRAGVRYAVLCCGPQ